jgi:cell pole-organizing protein PopZ
MSLPEGSSVEAVFERAVAGAFDPVLHQWMDGNKADLLAAVKPLIREWMDEHFPALLEGAVRNEVERVVKARGGK